MKQDYGYADLTKIKTVEIAQRTNLVHVDEFATVPKPAAGFSKFLETLPRVGHRTNAAQSFRQVVAGILEAVARQKPITWALGPHVVKYGLSPLFIELMDRGAVSAVLFNGASAIHDAEIALIGQTSEEMAGEIQTGRFGMAKETGEILNGAAKLAYDRNIGYGQALGQWIVDHDLPFSRYSLLAAAYHRSIPVTVHVAFGTDIVHMHPNVNGAHIGKATELDFRRIAALFGQFGGGGVHVNIASTVVLPEVFVKAMTIANNLNGTPITDFMTAHFDHLSEYRPLMNVVKRGTTVGGKGVELIGRIELMVPLLIACLLESLPA